NRRGRLGQAAGAGCRLGWRGECGFSLAGRRWRGSVRDPRRLSRGGNRRVNAAVRRAALTQACCRPAAIALLERRARTTRGRRDRSRATGPGTEAPGDAG
ncbi:MAG TPA: hypothetical protein VGG83_21125, partial [Trebonia sp.]